MELFSYIGWIPCINGHLDFGLMRVGIQGGFTNSKSKDYNSIEANFTCSNNNDSHDRRIVLQSKVDWRDSPDFHEDSGKFRIIVTAEVNKSNSMDERYLSGNLLIYPLSAEPETPQQRNDMNIHKLCHSIRESTKKIRDYTTINKQQNDNPLISDENQKRHGYFNRLEKITSAKEKINSLEGFSCSIKFKVDPNGVTKLEYNSKTSSLDDESTYLIARQAFYYLKYSIHTHKHHAAKQDSLTTITPTYSCSDNEKSNAGLRLICQLKRELTFLQRIQNTDAKEHPTNNAIGIIAYIKSLIFSLEQSLIIKPTIAERELERFKYINDSFAAQNCKIGYQTSNIELIKSKSKVWLGFIIISLWGIFNFTLKPAETNREAISTLTFTTGIIIILFTTFLTYLAIKRFYNARQLPEASEHLYNISYTKILAKIIFSIIFIAILLLIKLIVLH